jgi:hypothetical protein
VLDHVHALHSTAPSPIRFCSKTGLRLSEICLLLFDHSRCFFPHSGERHRDFNAARGNFDSRFIIFGQFIGIHIDGRFVKEGLLDTAAMKPIARGG